MIKIKSDIYLLNQNTKTANNSISNITFIPSIKEIKNFTKESLEVINTNSSFTNNPKSIGLINPFSQVLEKGISFVGILVLLMFSFVFLQFSVSVKAAPTICNGFGSSNLNWNLDPGWNTSSTGIDITPRSRIRSIACIFCSHVIARSCWRQAALTFAICASTSVTCTARVVFGKVVTSSVAFDIRLPSLV